MVVVWDPPVCRGGGDILGACRDLWWPGLTAIRHQVMTGSYVGWVLAPACV